jgi:hypothetical protein
MPPDSISRFLFRGNASGIGAHLRRPVDTIWKVQGASSLPTIGGVSESSVNWAEFKKSKDYKQLGDFRDYIRFDSIHTEASGDFVDQQAALAMTFGKAEEGKIATQTTVVSTVTGLVVANRLKIASASAGLVADYPKPRQQPPIRPRGNAIEGVSIDGHELAVELNEKVFAEKATLRDLISAYERDDAFYRKHRRHFVETGAGTGASLKRRAPLARGYIYCTVVSRIRWVGDPHPDAKIGNNVVTVPEFGRIYFGELLISEYARRLSMLRIKLGSPEGGDLCLSEVETNGSTWPD